MNCPKCGKELKEGSLYCELCGGEVQIVPVFEPEIEKEITQTLSGLAEELEEKKEKSKYHTFRESEHFYTIATMMAVLVVLFSICIVVNLYQYNSYQYQVSRASRYSAHKEYEKAAACMERAVAIGTDNEEAMLLLADYYHKNDQTQEAIAILKEYIAVYRESAQGYRKLISIYEGSKDYEALNALLLTCEDKEILADFGKYAAFPPEFSLEEGTYEEMLPLKLLANTTGKIYYTLDGTKPTQASEEYTAPIFLDSGTHEVSAVFINEYGLISEIVTKTYHFDFAIPNAPEVSLLSGIYNEPERILVNVPAHCEVYYTTNGLDPTRESILYKGPINMPLGESQFKFVTYGEKGLPGEITTRQYILELLHVTVSYQDAINSTVYYLQQVGYLSDLEGHAASVAGYFLYTCNTAVKVDNQIFYLIVENYMDETQKQSKTGNQFAVSAMNGLIYKAELNARGEYMISAFR